MFDTGAHNTHTLILMPSDNREKVKLGVVLQDAGRELGFEIESNCEMSNPFSIIYKVFYD